MAEIKRAVALGFFDGVHLGHGALLKKTAELAAAERLVPSMLLFDAEPESVITGTSPRLICSLHDRRVAAEKFYGIKYNVPLHFDREIMMMPWRNFVDMLVYRSGAACLIAGEDFRFGAGGRGTADMLAGYCADVGVGCEIVPEVRLDGKKVSSTEIRRLLEAGEIQGANALLGHRYFLTGPVVQGYHFGRTIGMPTVNMRYEEGVLVPRHGVYVSRAYLEDGRRLNAVTNIGVRPTLGGVDQVSVESHLMDFSGDLYGQNVYLEFCGFLRPEIKFSDTGELARQMRRDMEAARDMLHSKTE